MKRFTFLHATAFASALALNASGALALGDPALTNADDLIIGAGASYELAPGNHIFDDLVIADGATLIISAGTSITANRLHADEGTVQYKPGSSQNVGVPTAQFIVFDGSKLRSMIVNGHGIDGDGYVQGQRAQSGAAGQGACSRYDPFDWCDRSATAGGNGQHGASGSVGESALQATFYIVGLEPGAEITYNAVGGDGGRGQDGGNGGPGGNGSTLHTGKAGGNGGNGGDGGASGGSGQISVYLVADDATAEMAPDWIRVIANVAPGIPGDGGAPGAGGRNGNGCPGASIGQCRQLDSYPGQNGATGPMGLGPTSSDEGEFVRVQLMTRNTFAQFALAQQVLAN